MSVPTGQATLMIYMDKKLKEKLKVRAYRDDITVSVAIRDLVRQYVSGQVTIEDKED